MPKSRDSLAEQCSQWADACLAIREHHDVIGLRHKPSKRAPRKVCDGLFETHRVAILIGSYKGNLIPAKAGSVCQLEYGVAPPRRDRAIGCNDFNKDDKRVFGLEID